MRRKNYPTWVRLLFAVIGAIAVIVILVGALILVVNVLDALGAKVN